MRPWVVALEARGFRSRAVSLPHTEATRAVAAYRAAAPPALDSVIGGHSFGGRVASLLAAEEPYRGLILLSYPLHRPGHPEGWDERTAHWPSISCPVLLLSGGSDPFARVGLLRTATDRLADGRLILYPRVGHGLLSVLDQATDQVARFLAGLTQRSPGS
ncbi:MAG: dienelactone hydrolase family protein [Chloroflexota bacterium]|nr:dienelactone hydrolase family protein [Chloroflexota bacterium]